MLFFNIWLFKHYTGSRGCGSVHLTAHFAHDREETLLFDVVSDPEERRNLAPALPGVAAELLQEVEAIAKGRPRTPRCSQHNDCISGSQVAISLLRGQASL
jgi:hypothetical protein